MQMKMPIGIEDFKKLRDGGYHFVDKTTFIKDLLDFHADVTLITRPRRFGKTLTLSMLDYFFSIEKEKESRGLFTGLAIDRAGASYREKQGQYPVLFLSLKDIKQLTWADMLNLLKKIIGNYFVDHEYLVESSAIPSLLKEQFIRIMKQQADRGDLELSLSLLMRAMRLYYGRPVILLLDEYDAPIQSAWEHGFYKECISFMRTFLGSALKTNPDLDFAILTGVLRIAKESIFSGLNNLDVCGILSDNYADVMGFTPQEVAGMAENLGETEKLADIRYWYDGYHFGNAEIYNPWSVINYFAKGTFGDYWVNTGANSLISRMLERLSPERADTLRSLLNGNTLSATVREGLIYDDIANDEDALYSMLLTTGYLTAVRKELDFDGYTADLIIPNREVKDAYRSEIVGRMRGGLSSTRLKVMLRDLLNGNAASFTKALTFYLEYLASSFDVGNKEIFYHGFVLGMTALLVPEYEVISNREAGYGWFDLAIVPHKAGHAGVLIEFKRTEKEVQLSKAAEAALEQIKVRDYGSEFKKRGITDYWKYGIAFCGKKVCVKQGE